MACDSSQIFMAGFGSFAGYSSVSNNMPSSLKGSDCVVWSCSTLIKVTQLCATQSESLDYMPSI